MTIKAAENYQSGMEVESDGEIRGQAKNENVDSYNQKQYNDWEREDWESYELTDEFRSKVPYVERGRFSAALPTKQMG